MRKIIVLFFSALGAGRGLLGSLEEDWDVMAGMTFIYSIPGLIVGLIIVGVIGGIGKKGRRPAVFDDDDTLSGIDMTPDDLMQNYWRDKGRPQLVSGPDSDFETDHSGSEFETHYFDPDDF